MVNDVEKRWHDPRTLRAAVTYAAVVVFLAAVAFVIYAVGDRHVVGWAMATPGVVFIGALGAFAKTYREWRAGRTWPIWQGAGWFLLTVTLLTFSVPTMGLGDF